MAPLAFLLLLRSPVLGGLLLSLLLLPQCRKAGVDPAFPPESTSGANKAGCLVDGQVLVARDARGQSGTELAFRLGPRANEANFSLGLLDKEDASKPSVMIRADSMVLEEGKSYPFEAATWLTAAAHPGSVQGICFTRAGGVYGSTAPNSGTLTITRLDRQARLLAGRFAFIGTDKITGKQVRVSEGRFDFQSQ